MKVFCFLFSPIIVGHGKKTKILKKSTVTHHSKKLFPHTLSNLSSVCKNSATSSGVPPRRPFSWRYFTPFLGFLLNLVQKTQTNTSNKKTHAEQGLTCKNVTWLQF